MLTHPSRHLKLVICEHSKARYVFYLSCSILVILIVYKNLSEKYFSDRSKKIEKLVKAVYLLTGLMPEKEPMRERARTLANKMLESALSMSDRVWGEETYQKNLLSAIGELSVLFDVAENAKIMSKMNHQIITSELKKLADFIITSSSNYSSAKIAFEPNLFDGNYNYVPEQTFKAPSAPIMNAQVKNDPVTNTDVSYKGQKETSVENTKKAVFPKITLKRG